MQTWGLEETVRWTFGSLDSAAPFFVLRADGMGEMHEPDGESFLCKCV